MLLAKVDYSRVHLVVVAYEAKVFDMKNKTEMTMKINVFSIEQW